MIVFKDIESLQISVIFSACDIVADKTLHTISSASFSYVLVTWCQFHGTFSLSLKFDL